MVRNWGGGGQPHAIDAKEEDFGGLWLIRRGLAVVFMAAIALALMSRGAVSPSIEALVACIFSLTSCIALVMLGEPRMTAPVFRIALLIGLALAGWVIIQTIPIEGLANPVWRELGGISDNPADTISVAPTDSLSALVTLALPFAVFIGGLVLFPTDAEAERLLSYIAILGGGLAIYAVFEFSLFPNILLAGEKKYYLDSLTAPFVNRNTAGTFYGVVSIVFFSRVYMALVRIKFSLTTIRLGIKRAHKSSRWPVVLDIVLLLFCFVALFLTKSRGAVGSTFLAYLLFVPLAVSVWPDAGSPLSFDSGRSRLTRRILSTILALVLIMIIGLVFADRALFRAEVQGLDDARFCVIPGIFHAIRENELVGTGFGTFRLFFPAHRDPHCGIYGVWDRAHSVYLEGYLGLGLIFAIALVLGLGVLLWVLVGGIASRRRLKVYPILGSAVLLLVLVHSGVDFSVQIPGFAVTFAAIMAAVVTISRGRIKRGDSPACAAP